MTTINNNIDYSIFELNLLEHIRTLPFHKIAEISKKINKERRIKYPDKHEVKYSDYQKAIPDDLFYNIINYENDDRFKLLYKMMYYIGLRISEVVLVKTIDINDDWIIKINNIKCNRIDKLIVPKRLRTEINNFKDKYKKEIAANSDYLFFSNNKQQVRDHLSKDYVRNRFRETTLQLNINKIYDKSDERDNKRTERRLFLYSTHSLRHGFAHILYKKLQHIKEEKIKIKIIMKALRHKSFEHTLTYLSVAKEEVFSVIENI